MTSPVVRVYGTEQQANDAIARLQEYGFAEDGILALRPGAEGGADSPEALRSAVSTGFLPQERAELYADALHHGETLVAVRPPFGRGQVAIDILDSFAPVETGLRRQGPEALWDVAAPLSSALHAPAVWRGQPAPYSRLTGGQILWHGRSFGAKYPAATRPLGLPSRGRRDRHGIGASDSRCSRAVPPPSPPT